MYLAMKTEIGSGGSKPSRLARFALLALLCPAAHLMAQTAASPSVALPRIESAISDGEGRIVVNGKPFFPILLYDVPADPESLKKFHDHGFNMVTVAKTEEAEAARVAGLYGAAHGKKIENFDSVLLAIGMDSPVLNLKPPLIDNLKANLEKVRTEIPHRPVMHAIGYWLNEPAGVVANTLPPPEKYEEVVRTIDVSAPYLYPVPYQPISSVGEAVARASIASEGKKPLLPILQIFAWTVADRYPTPAELKCMVYLSLIHGARGIGYYSYNHVTGKKGVTFADDQPEIWNSLKPVNAELSRFGPFLLESQPDHTVAMKVSDDRIKFRAATRDRSHLLLLANPTDGLVAVTLEFKEREEGMLKPVVPGPTVAIRDRSARVMLEANGTAAFEY